MITSVSSSNRGEIKMFCRRVVVRLPVFLCRAVTRSAVFPHQAVVRSPIFSWAKKMLAPSNITIANLFS